MPPWPSAWLVIAQDRRLRRLPFPVRPHVNVLAAALAALHTLFSVLLVADVLHPFDGLTVQRLLNGDMGHCRRGLRPMPMFFTGREPNNIAWANFLDWTSPTLHPSTPAGDNQSLSEWMRMPCSPCTRLEGDAITGRARWFLALKQWINAHRASEPFSRPFAGRLRSASFNFHRWSPTSYSCGHLCALYGLGCRHDNSAANERRI
jgi:hypothetical protein